MRDRNKSTEPDYREGSGSVYGIRNAPSTGLRSQLGIRGGQSFSAAKILNRHAEWMVHDRDYTRGSNPLGVNRGRKMKYFSGHFHFYIVRF